MHPNENEADFLEAMARYTQLLQGQLGLTEEILQHMHRITVTIGQKQTTGKLTLPMSRIR